MLKRLKMESTTRIRGKMIRRHLSTLNGNHVIRDIRPLLKKSLALKSYRKDTLR